MRRTLLYMDDQLWERSTLGDCNVLPCVASFELRECEPIRHFGRVPVLLREKQQVSQDGKNHHSKCKLTDPFVPDV